MLERLSLDAIDDLDKPLAIFETAPRLHSIEFNRSVKPSECQLPWLQLRNCKISYLPKIEWYHLLWLCPYLIHCNLGIPMDDDIPEILATPLVHSHLRSLCIGLVDEKTQSLQFFNELTLPALHDLDISLRGCCPITFTSRSMSLFLDRSLCNLQRMSLRIQWTGDNLIICLQELLSLVELTIFEERSLMLTEQVLKRMTPDISGSSLSGLPLLVPKLKHLALSANFHLKDQVILDMVQSRMELTSFCPNSSDVERSNQVEILECFALDITQQLLPRTISWMAFWQQLGLKILVKSLGKFVVNAVDGSLFADILNDGPGGYCKNFFWMLCTIIVGTFRDDSRWLRKSEDSIMAGARCNGLCNSCEW